MNVCLDVIALSPAEEFLGAGSGLLAIALVVAVIAAAVALIARRRRK